VKFNLILLGIFIILGFFSYYHEEIGEIKKKEEEKEKKQVFKTDHLGPLTEFVVLNDRLILKDDFFYSKNHGHRISGVAIQQTFNLLSKIHMGRVIPESQIESLGESYFVPAHNPELRFVFKQGQMIFKLGKKLDFGKEFYMKVSQNGESRVVVAYDTSEIESIVRKEDSHRSSSKFLRLKRVFERKSSDYFSVMIMEGDQLKNWRTIIFKNFRNRSFKLLLDEKLTVPSSPVGIGINFDKVLSFTKNLFELSASQTIEKSAAKVDGEPISELEIEKLSGDKINLKLYRALTLENSYLVFHSEKESVFVIEPSMGKIFFQNAQHFWKKVPLSKNRLGESVTLSFNNKKEFLAEHQENLNLLKTLLASESDMVTRWQSSIIRGNNVMKVNIGNQVFSLVFQDKELSVYDHKKNVRYSYFSGDHPPVKLQPSDYISENTK